jgi:hypothetical protein
MDTLAAREHRRAERLTDLLDSIRAQLRTRLDELRPLVREYERLQAAEAALAGGAPTSATCLVQPTRGGSQARRGNARPAGVRRRSSSSAERQVNREKVVALVRERPGITKAELKDAAGLSSAGVAQNLRRMLDRGQVREQALPGGATSYRIADDQTAPSASGRQGATGQPRAPGARRPEPSQVREVGRPQRAGEPICRRPRSVCLLDAR